eukprot:1145201-Pelagomonas_calceolata.AAC.2
MQRSMQKTHNFRPQIAPSGLAGCCFQDDGANLHMFAWNGGIGEEQMRCVRSYMAQWEKNGTAQALEASPDRSVEGRI